MTALRDMSDDQLLRERAHWNMHVKDARVWGAALEAASKFRDECDKELRRRSQHALVQWNCKLKRFGPSFGVRQ